MNRTERSAALRASLAEINGDPTERTLAALSAIARGPVPPTWKDISRAFSKSGVRVPRGVADGVVIGMAVSKAANER
ncbi:hypothetical protein ACIQLJ_08505 [Microbacterium sp. NPDC091313]